jgi:kinesin family protein 15
MIANVSPSNTCFFDTISTLKFAQRAKLVKNSAHINEDTTGNVDKLREIIKKLKVKIADLETTNLSITNIQSLQMPNLEMGSPHTPNRNSDFKSKRDQIRDLERNVSSLLSQLKEGENLIDTNSKEHDKLTSQYQATIEALENQKMRDRMIIKFRDEAIEKLSSKNGDDKEKIISNLKREITALTKAVDENPNLLKLQTLNQDIL